MANRFDPSDTLVSSSSRPSSHVRMRVSGEMPAAAANDTGRRPLKKEAPAVRIALPLGLAFVGGALGGLVGGGAMALDIQIAFSAAPIWIKALAMFAVTWGAVSLFILALWRVQAGLGGGSSPEAKNRPRA